MTGREMKDEMIRETARMLAQQDALGRPIDQLLVRATEIIDKLIADGFYADPMKR